MKTVTVKGKVYQVGAIYWAAGEYLELVSADNDGFLLSYPDKSAIPLAAKKIGVVAKTLGTIEDAPLELKEGCHYLCSFDRGLYQGVMYCVGGGVLVFGHDHSSPKEGVAFEPLYKMVKAE